MNKKFEFFITRFFLSLWISADGAFLSVLSYLDYF